MKEHHVNLVCTFCGKSQGDIRNLIAGPTVYICNECIRMYQNLISKETGDFPTTPMLAKTAVKLGLGLKSARRWALITRFLTTLTNLGCSLRGRGSRRPSTSLIVPRNICRRAILLARELKRFPENDQESSPTTKRHQRDLCCSFCGETRDDVLKLVGGPTVYICDECIDLCHDIIAEESGEEKGRRHALQEFADKARRLALHLNNLPALPRTISNRASLLAADLELLATPDKAG